MRVRSPRASIVWGVALLLPTVCCWAVYRSGAIETNGLAGWLHEGSAFWLLVVVYPVVEELAFRGVIQGALLRWSAAKEMLPGITVANGLTSALFVAMHFVHHPPMWAVAVLVPSLVFGYFRDRFGSVLPSVVLHAFYNLIFYTTMGIPS
jgi:membrane protease YdiL (CAAX protease family)